MLLIKKCLSRFLKRYARFSFAKVRNVFELCKRLRKIFCNIFFENERLSSKLV